jgi:hypothetical protein
MAVLPECGRGRRAGYMRPLMIGYEDLVTFLYRSHRMVAVTFL